MPDIEIEALRQKLDETLSQIKETHDPERKRGLMKEMRLLMAKLDSLVFDLTSLTKQATK